MYAAAGHRSRNALAVDGLDSRLGEGLPDVAIIGVGVEPPSDQPNLSGTGHRGNRY
jgi:hypothetical protein